MQTQQKRLLCSEYNCSCSRIARGRETSLTCTHTHSSHADPSFTVDRVMAVFEKLKEWRELFGSDSNYCIPRSRWAVISRDFADEQRQRQQAGLYYHHYYPNASWNDLAVALYKKGEREVLELIKPHLDNVKGMYCIYICKYSCNGLIRKPQ